MKKRRLFDRNELQVRPIKEREHGLNLSSIKELGGPGPQSITRGLKEAGRRIIQAKRKRSSVILMLGGHVLRSGVQRFIIDLMERGYLSCVAMNGSGIIHDFEFALIGATTESVARYIQKGQFGLWRETGRINDYINQGDKRGMGMGEAVGRAIWEGKFPHKGISVLASAYRLKVPVTVHVGIGYDIIHEHPNCDGAAAGAASYRDFLKFAEIVQHLEGGAVMNFGSAVMAPEVFLKALSMARNIACQRGRAIRHFTTLVCDLCKLPKDISREPDKRTHGYYFRPWKTMLVRAVADGGRGIYVRGAHSDTLPALWAAVNEAEKAAQKR